MIIQTMPMLENDKDREEVRKALINLVAQLNLELDAIRARLAALEATP